MTIDNSSQPLPLRILIAGAGIGGLTTALGLRQQGHDVTVLEQSRLLKAYGAAITIPTNANAVLRRLGVRLENHGGIEAHGFNQYQGDVLVRCVDQRAERATWPHPYHFILRPDLYKALQQAATSLEGKGKPVELRTGSRVCAVDAEAGKVTLEDGTELVADVVVGADGVHSAVRSAIPSSKGCKPFPYTMSSFRTLIPADELEKDPLTADLVANKNYFNMFRKGDRTVIMYTGNGGRTMNLACTQPNALAKADEKGGWNASGSKDRMIELYKDFGPRIEALLSYADPSSVGMWQLMDMQQLPEWVHGRTALLGDAAHPFMPFLGQGGAMAIEDAGAFAALFPAGTRSDDVVARLQLFQKVRYERAIFVWNQTRRQVEMSRPNGAGKENGMQQQAPGERILTRFAAMNRYLQDYDAWEIGTRALNGEPVWEVTKPPMMD